MILMIAGVALKVATHDLAAPAVEMLSLWRARLGAGDRLMGCGILALALTPAARVLILLGLWARERDWRFVAVAGVVVVTLAIAVAVGGG
jgi:uncharacterized membrane protein